MEFPERSMRTSESCVETCIAVEKRLCGIGDGWGRISGSMHLLLWWSFRHMVYLGASVLLVMYIPQSLLPLVVFFFVVHLYKFVRFGFYLAYDKKNEQKHGNISKESKETTKSNETFVDKEVP